MKQNILCRIAETGNEFEQARHLFKEYADALGVDLSFQEFEKELETIHVQYNKPVGGLLLIYINGHPIACTGVRRLNDETAELKRMYVKSEFRGFRIGVELLQRSLSLAKVLGYKKIRLDTLENMVKAQELYKSFGFYIIPSYRFNPISGTIYMEKIL
ncbi:MAG TPA: GNAT family N-acetyltransferase [Puia sp.]